MALIGILGGTFNPIHNGHIDLMKNSANKLGLERVLVIPNGVSYMKQGVLDAEDRFNMAVLATRDMGNVSVSRIEIDRVGNSYTVDTLEELKRRDRESGTENEYYLIVGSDTLYQMEAWYRKERVYELCNIAVSLRQEETSEDLLKQVNKLTEQGAKIVMVESNSDVSGLSSTLIREKVQAGGSISGLVHSGVETYIREHNLYN